MTRITKNAFGWCIAAMFALVTALPGGLVADDGPAARQPSISNGASDDASDDSQVERDSRLLRQARALFGTLREKMPGSENDTQAMIDLGRRLYFEKGMSINKKQSCNDCHRLDGGRGGVDNQVTAEGALGKFGPRNAADRTQRRLPHRPVLGRPRRRFGRAGQGTAAEPDRDGDGRRSSGGRTHRRKASTPTRSPSHSLIRRTPSRSTISRAAIAAFERTMISRGRFDDFLAGETDALTSHEKEGLSLVIQSRLQRVPRGAAAGRRAVQGNRRLSSVPEPRGPGPVRSHRKIFGQVRL